MYQHNFLHKQESTETIAAAPPEEEGSHWFIITISIIGGIVILAGAIYGYFKYRQRQVYLDYSVNPEAGIPKQSIGFNQRRKYLTWKINDGPSANPAVKQQDKSNYYGNYIELKFNGKVGEINSIIATKSVVNDHMSYFEIEIEDNSRKSDIIIGFCSDKEFSNQFSLGRSLSSVGFHSADGMVFAQNKLCFDYKFTAVYGETLGIGIRQKDGRIWLSYNGKFLNPPPPSEIKKKDDDKDDKDDEEQEEDEDQKKKLKELEELRQQQKVTINSKSPLFPVISVNGPCKVNLNVGAMEFRMNQKEIAHGLLN